MGPSGPSVHPSIPLPPPPDPLVPLSLLLSPCPSLSPPPPAWAPQSRGERWGRGGPDASVLPVPSADRTPPAPGEGRFVTDGECAPPPRRDCGRGTQASGPRRAPARGGCLSRALGRDSSGSMRGTQASGTSRPPPPAAGAAVSIYSSRCSSDVTLPRVTSPQNRGSDCTQLCLGPPLCPALTSLCNPGCELIRGARSDVMGNPFEPRPPANHLRAPPPGEGRTGIGSAAGPAS